MGPFARIVVGYHGCPESFAKDMLTGKKSVADWRASQNEWDWLGDGIYFWEHAPKRALRWARERFSGRQKPAVLGAIIQLGRCFDLLAESYPILAQRFQATGRPLPENRGREGKRRELDCLVINESLDDLRGRGVACDTVRGAFLEGDPVYPGARFSRESHIQVAVRNSACILGIFRPNLVL